MDATVADVSGKLNISKFPNRVCFGKKCSGLCNFFWASKICLFPAIRACDLKKLLAKTGCVVINPSPAKDICVFEAKLFLKMTEDFQLSNLFSPTNGVILPVVT